MKVKCYSVRLEEFTQVSPKCYKAVDFNGNSDLIPSSQFFGDDYEVKKSDAYYISAWILEKNNIQYSKNKERWFDKDTGKMLPQIKIKKNIPKKINRDKIDIDESLIR